ncbi:MAG TPA: hypothetical protein VM580_25460 [Labilithrix sp.]|nr:hypothetical protein [Labilithrix sp.]
MDDLSRAVDDLVATATRDVAPPQLKRIVEKVLDAFDRASERPRNTALRTMGRALGKVEGRGAQILCLALGALVESGANPELAWPAVENGLRGLLNRATAFATAVVKHAKDEHVDTAIGKSGAAVAKKMPRNADAWNALPARCLAAVACLTRSKKVRSVARKNAGLQEAAWPLSDVVAEVGYLLQSLRIVDDEHLLVLAPSNGLGWRVSIDAMPSNAELSILLADALVGDPKRGRLAGKRPDPKAVRAIREGTAPKRAASVTVPFHLVAWTALSSDGSLPPAQAAETDHFIWSEGLVADIPAAGKQRVVLLQPPPRARPIPVAPSFESLRPELRVDEELSFDEVERVLKKLGKVAAKSHSHAMASAADSATTKKTTRKTARSKKPSSRSKATGSKKTATSKKTTTSKKTATSKKAATSKKTARR